MIKLDVEEYCHDCPSFESETIKTGGSTYVTCKYFKPCYRLMTYLKKTIGQSERRKR